MQLEKKIWLTKQISCFAAFNPGSLDLDVEEKKESRLMIWSSEKSAWHMNTGFKAKEIFSKAFFSTVTQIVFGGLSQ